MDLGYSTLQQTHITFSFGLYHWPCSELHFSQSVSKKRSKKPCPIHRQILTYSLQYPLVKQQDYGKSQCLVGKSTIKIGQDSWPFFKALRPTVINAVGMQRIAGREWPWAQSDALDFVVQIGSVGNSENHWIILELHGDTWCTSVLL